MSIEVWEKKDMNSGELLCCLCKKEFDRLIDLYDDVGDDIFACKDCLKKALEMLE